jgi:hypothetical protein
VFAENYKLRTLDDLARYIKQYRHLPGMPSASEMAHNGIELSNLLNKHLEKIEELTLYLIELKTENEALKARLTMVEEQLQDLHKP